MKESEAQPQVKIKSQSICPKHIPPQDGTCSETTKIGEQKLELNQAEFSSKGDAVIWRLKLKERDSYLIITVLY